MASYKFLPGDIPLALTYCQFCSFYQPLRTCHCARAGRCVLFYMRYSRALHQPIGIGNAYAYFWFLFLLTLSLALKFGVVTWAAAVLDTRYGLSFAVLPVFAAISLGLWLVCAASKLIIYCAQVSYNSLDHERMLWTYPPSVINPVCRLFFGQPEYALSLPLPFERRSRSVERALSRLQLVSEPESSRGAVSRASKPWPADLGGTRELCKGLGHLLTNLSSLRRGAWALRRMTASALPGEWATLQLEYTMFSCCFLQEFGQRAFNSIDYRGLWIRRVPGPEAIVKARLLAQKDSQNAGRAEDRGTHSGYSQGFLAAAGGSPGSALFLQRRDSPASRSLESLYRNSHITALRDLRVSRNLATRNFLIRESTIAQSESSLRESQTRRATDVFCPLEGPTRPLRLSQAPRVVTSSTMLLGERYTVAQKPELED